MTYSVRYLRNTGLTCLASFHLRPTHTFPDLQFSKGVVSNATSFWKVNATTQNLRKTHLRTNCHRIQKSQRRRLGLGLSSITTQSMETRSSLTNITQSPRAKPNNHGPGSALSLGPTSSNIQKRSKRQVPARAGYPISSPSYSGCLRHQRQRDDRSEQGRLQLELQTGRHAGNQCYCCAQETGSTRGRLDM